MISGALLAAALLLGQAPAEPGKPELVLWHAYRGAEREALESIANELNATRSDLHLKLLAIPYDALVDKITAAVPRGRGPDLFISAHDTIGDWAEAGILAPLTARTDPQTLKEFFDETVPPLIYKGELYGLPLAFKSCALFYNPDLVKKVPATTDELLAIARQVASPDEGRYGLVYETNLLYFHAPLLFGFGGRLFDEAGRPTLDDPHNVESARFAQGLVQRERVTPREINGPLVVSLVNQGKTAFAINGPWMLGDLDPGARFAVAKLPVVSQTGLPMRPFVSAEAVFVSAKGTQQDLAHVVATLLVNKTSARTRLLTGKQPVATRAAWVGVENQIDPNLLAFKAQLVDTVGTPNTPAMKSTWSQVDTALNRAVNGGEDPQPAFADAQRKLLGILQMSEQREEARLGHSGAAILLGALGLGFVLLIGVKLRRYGLRRLGREIVDNRHAYLYAAPALIALGALVLVPFAFGVGMGFYRHEWGRYSFVGLQNFADIVAGSDSRFWFTLLITVLWTTVNVTLHLVIGVSLAMLLNRPSLRGRTLYRVLFVVPWAVPNYITALIWKGMFHSDFGAVNTLLGIQGFSWMNQTWSAFAANVVTNTWLGFPFMMVITLGALQSIPTDLYEAADLDGATRWQRFTRITVPLLKPALAPAVLLGVVWTFNMFNIIYLVSGGAPNGSTDILITEAFRWAFERGRGGAFGYAAAYSTMIFLMLLGYSWVSGRVSRNIEGAME
ncbi:MAG: extracellular solute-binding protein [Pseudomonadota bacterium]